MAKPKKKAFRNVKYPCEVCGIVLSSTHNLKIHVETQCSSVKNFVCDICESRFLTQNSLKTHLNSLHFGEKKFVCSFCANRFLSKGQLKVHERSHTKEKSFICNVCGKGFSHRESLVTHSTIHTGIKPYICECCSLTFSCIGNLIKHRRVRPNSCGLPIYSNKKICKRTGVKCKEKTKIVVATFDESVESKSTAKLKKNEPEQKSIVYQSEDLTDTYQHIPDHQYTFVSTSHDSQMEEYARKEMDVFDYIGIEIRNIEEREKEMQLKNEATIAEAVQEEFVDENIEQLCNESSEVNDDEEMEEEETIVIERVYHVNEEYYDEEEPNSFFDIVDGTSFHCKLCPKIYQKRNITMKHLKVEHGIVMENYNYDNSNRYRKPQKDLNWKCQFCPKRYTSKRLAVRHEIAHGPNGELTHKCSCCAIYFQTSEERDSHQFSTHEDRLICKIESCKKRFDNPEKLVSHTKYAHTDKKMSIKKYVFVCQLCGRNFNTKVALSDHERSNCGKTPIYQCSHCDKNYHSAGSLKCHLTIHTNTLEFTCSFCDKKFRTKGQLTIHLRSHTKEKNYKCSHCPAEFSHRESLLTHNTLHTGIKRFECSNCSKRFSCISNLLAHRKSHRNTCGDSQTTKVMDAENSVRICKTEIS